MNTTSTINPEAVPVTIMNMLVCATLRGAMKSFSDPSFRAEFAEWLE